MEQKKYPLFSNGTEFMLWQSRNCEQCVKAVFYNEKKDFYPKYRCAIQKHIEEAAITDGCGTKRVYNATHLHYCPHKITEQKAYTRKQKENKAQLQLWSNGLS